MTKELKNKKILFEILQKKQYLQFARNLKNKITFSGQNEGEVIFAFFRSAPIRNIGWIMELTFLFVFPLLIPSIIDVINSLNLFEIPASFNFYAVFFVSYYAYLITLTMLKVIDWYFDICIVTSQRFIEIDFKPYGNISVREIWLEDIDVIKTKSSGLLGSIMNYGNIKLITRTDSGGTELQYVSNFNEIKNLISDLSKITKKYTAYVS